MLGCSGVARSSAVWTGSAKSKVVGAVGVWFCNVWWGVIRCCKVWKGLEQCNRFFFCCGVRDCVEWCDSVLFGCSRGVVPCSRALCCFSSVW